MTEGPAKETLCAVAESAASPKISMGSSIPDPTGTGLGDGEGEGRGDGVGEGSGDGLGMGEGSGVGSGVGDMFEIGRTLDELSVPVVNDEKLHPEIPNANVAFKNKSAPKFICFCGLIISPVP